MGFRSFSHCQTLQWIGPAIIKSIQILGSFLKFLFNYQAIMNILLSTDINISRKELIILLAQGQSG